MLMTRRLTTLPQIIALSPQQMLAGLRLLVVGAACILAFDAGVQQRQEMRVLIITGMLLGQQSFTFWGAVRGLSARQERWLLIVNLICVSLATALLGPYASALFLLYALLLVEAAMLLNAKQVMGFASVTGAAYLLACIIGAPYGLRGWLAKGCVVNLLEIGFFFVVAGVSTNLVSVWEARREHIIQLSLLDELSLLLADTRRLHDVLARLVELVPQALNVQACVVAIDEPGSDRRIWANLGADASTLIDEALLERGTAANHKTRRGIVRTHVGDSPYAAIYSLPLEIDERSVGMLSIARVTPEPFTLRDQRIFESLARHAEQSLRNARLYRLEAEAASQSRELERFKSEMLASVSHEFRLPLASISLAVETLIEQEQARTTDPNDLRLRLLLNIQRSAHRLTGFVQDVLDVARLESNQLELRFGPCDLVALAQAAVEHLMPQCEIKRQRLRLECDLPPDAASVVRGDVKRLEQVLSNLLTNAYQYTPEGGEIVLALMPASRAHIQGVVGPEEARQSVALCVRDTGPGIPPEERGKIFDRFSRGTAGRRRSAGAGLGLHIARSVIELHGGKLWVAGNAAGGSSFWCILPLHTGEADSSSEEIPATADTLDLPDEDDIEPERVAARAAEFSLETEDIRHEIVDRGR